MIELTNRIATPQPARLTPLRRRGHLGPVHVLQVLAVEALVVGAVALAGQTLAVGIGAAVLATLLAVVVLARRHERWWLEQWAFTRLFQRRTSVAAPDLPHDPLADLHRLAAGLTITEIGGPPTDEPADAISLMEAADDELRAEPTIDGTPSVVAVACDDAGWYAVAEIRSDATMVEHPSQAVPLAHLVRTLSATGQAGVLLQLVTQGVPVPVATIDPSAPAARSYRNLVGAVGPMITSVERTCWLVVRLDSYQLAEAGADEYAAERAPAVTAALLRLAVRSLRRLGRHAEPLNRAALLVALRSACGLTDRHDAPHEEWRAWHAGHASHACYWVRDWPQPAAIPAMLQALASIPAAQTTVATMVAVPPPGTADDPHAGDTEMRCLVRMTAPANLLDAVDAAVLRCADEHATGLTRLDGEHGPAIYATAPTGGGSW